jgi:hypothetical protein
MNFLIAENDLDHTEFWKNLPAFKEIRVGIKTFASLVEHLTRIDLARNFHTEWTKRMKRLRQYSVKHGIHVTMAHDNP